MERAMSSPNLTAVAIRHVPHEGLGAFAQPLADAGFDVRYHDAWIAPDPATSGALDADLLVVLGGPMGVPEADRHPFLHREIDVLKRRLADDRPTLGVCLGAQLIASASGARVFPGGAFELGYLPVTLTAEGRASCLAPLAATPRVLQWHGDTYELPDGATRLASSALYREQAFSIGKRVLAIQFHPEVDAAMLETWIDAGEDELRRGGVDARTLRESARELEPSIAPTAHALLGAWLRDVFGDR